MAEEKRERNLEVLQRLAGGETLKSISKGFPDVEYSTLAQMVASKRALFMRRIDLGVSAEEIACEWGVETSFIERLVQQARNSRLSFLERSEAQDAERDAESTAGEPLRRFLDASDLLAALSYTNNEMGTKDGARIEALGGHGDPVQSVRIDGVVDIGNLAQTLNRFVVSRLKK